MSLVLDGLQDSDLHPTAKLVAVALADFANFTHGGVAFPSIAALSRKVSVSESQVRCHLQALEARGWIAKESAGKGGKGQTTRYRLDLRRLQSLASKKATAHRRVKGNGPPSRRGVGLANGPPSSTQRATVAEPNGPPSSTQRATVAEPNGPPSSTQRATVGEQEVKGNEKEVELERGAGATVIAIQTVNPLKKISLEPPRPHLTREQQLEAVRKATGGQT